MEPLLDAKDVKKVLRCSLPLVYKLADKGLRVAILLRQVGVNRKWRFFLKNGVDDITIPEDYSQIPYKLQLSVG